MKKKRNGCRRRLPCIVPRILANGHVPSSDREACMRLEMGLAPDPKVVVRHIFRSPVSLEARAVLVCLSLAMHGIMRSRPKDDTWPLSGIQDHVCLPPLLFVASSPLLYCHSILVDPRGSGWYKMLGRRSRARSLRSGLMKSTLVRLFSPFKFSSAHEIMTPDFVVFVIRNFNRRRPLPATRYPRTVRHTIGLQKFLCVRAEQCGASFCEKYRAASASSYA